MIVVARTYTPKAGASGLVGLLKSVNDQNIANSLPALKIYRKFLGAHGVMVTTQEWDSLENYNDSRTIVREIENSTGLFKKIYPLLEKTHETAILEEV